MIDYKVYGIIEIRSEYYDPDPGDMRSCGSYIKSKKVHTFLDKNEFIQKFIKLRDAGADIQCFGGEFIEPKVEYKVNF